MITKKTAHQIRVHQNYFHRQVHTNIYGTFNNFLQSAIQIKNGRCHEKKPEPPRLGVQKNQ